MICPICKFKKIKSIVKPHGGSSTAMYCSPYYDENGNYHNHDLNIINFIIFRVSQIVTPSDYE